MIKQKDIIVLMVTVFFSVVFSILITNLVLSNPKDFAQSVDVVPSISTSFPLPNNKYFNNQSIDSTQIINISPNNNQQPFTGTRN